MDDFTSMIAAEVLEELEQRCLLNGMCTTVSIAAEIDLTLAIQQYIKEAKGE